MVRAAVMVGPGRIEIREFPRPEIGEGEALLKMELSGICGTDKNMYLGNVVHPGGVPTPFPIIPGHENVGVVEEVGERAAGRLEATGEELKAGDRVVPMCDVPREKLDPHLFGYVGWMRDIIAYGTLVSCKEKPHLFGGWAEYMYVYPNTPLFKVPDNVPPEAAVLTEPMAVAYGSFLRAAVPCSPVYDIQGYSPGDTVVVLGPGPIGLVHSIMFRIAGAGDIIMVGAGTEADRWRLEYIEREFGSVVDYVVNEASPEARVEEVRRLTGNRGADLVVECAGSPRAVLQGLEMLRDKGGTLLSVGVFIDTGETIEVNPARLISHKNVRIIGVTNHPLQGYEKALRLMSKYISRIPFTKVVTHTFPLERAEEAMRTAVGGKAIKVAIRPNPS